MASGAELLQLMERKFLPGRFFAQSEEPAVA